MRKVFIAIMFVFSLLSAPFVAGAADVEGVEIVKFGIFKADLITKEEASGAAAGMKNIVKNVVFVEQTTNIPAHMGTRFGFEFFVKGRPAGDKIDLVYKYLHPRMTNPQNNRSFTSQEITTRNKEVGKAISISYTFDYSWEAVPGEWTLQVFYEGRKLAEKTFYIYKP